MCIYEKTVRTPQRLIVHLESLGVTAAPAYSHGIIQFSMDSYTELHLPVRMLYICEDSVMLPSFMRNSSIMNF